MLGTGAGRGHCGLLSRLDIGLGSVVFIAISHDEFKPIVKNTAAAAVEKSS